MIASEPILPQVSALEKAWSRVQRYVLRQPSRFFFFSESALDGNARRAKALIQRDVDGAFFRSATPWVHCTPAVPYFVYLDVVFQTFFENTFDNRHFHAFDLERIYSSEAGFLENAAAVFFESAWGMEQAKGAYKLSGTHYHAIYRGGALDPPVQDTWSGNPLMLLSIAMKFQQKGGDIILEAFKRLKRDYPGLRWHIIGGPPDGDWQNVDGIVHEGVLNPDHPVDRSRFRQLLSNAFLLLHPTREDTSPLVLTEAACFGCPSISVRRFAIPELVRDGETGRLLDWPVEPETLADAVRQLIENPAGYRRMRQAAFDSSRGQFGWELIGQRMAAVMKQALEYRGHR